MHPHHIPTVEIDALPVGAPLLDVREDDEWLAGHAPSAVHIAMNDVPAVLAADPDRLPTERPLPVICKVGGRSAQVVAYLRGAGIDAVNVTGGMLAWQQAERPMTSETGAPAQVL